MSIFPKKVTCHLLAREGVHEKVIMKNRLGSKVNFTSTCTEGGAVNLCQFMGLGKYYT